MTNIQGSELDVPEQGVGRRRLLASSAAAAGGLTWLLSGSEPAGAEVVDADLLRLAESVRGGATMVGGGDISVSDLQGTAPNQFVHLAWSKPFTVGYAVSPTFSTDGTFSIAQPAASSVITGVNRSDVTVGASGVPLGPNDALFYVLPIGSGAGSDPSNFRMVQPAGGPSPQTYDTPGDWVLVASNVPGTNSTRIGTGITLVPGGHWDESWGTVGTGSPELSHETSDLPVTTFGAVAGRAFADAQTSSGSKQLTSATASFSSTDVGSLVAIRGAAAAGTGGGPNGDLWTTIESVVSPTEAQLATPATNGVTGAEAHIGPDCRGAFEAALAAASANGGGIVSVPSGVYLLGRYVYGTGLENVQISGGATIRYGSANQANQPDGVAVSTSQARSAFLFYDSKFITVRGLRFVGDYASMNMSENAGSPVYGKAINTTQRGVDFLTLDSVQSIFGCSLLQHDERISDPPQNAAAHGARLVNCISWGARGYVSLPSHSVVTGCHFELPPDDSSYTAQYGPSRGSTHCIYLTAGRESIIFTGNTFRFLRRWAVKASGTTFPVRGVVFSGNDVWDCGGGVQFGADDDQLHGNFVCTSNSFFNTGTRPAGWSEGVTVDVIGCKNAIVSNNTFLFEGAVTSASGRSVINVSSHGPQSAPTEQVLIEGNLLQGLLVPEGQNPAFNKGIHVARVGEYATDPVGGGITGDPSPTALAIRIAGNQIKGCVGVAFWIERTLNALVENNQVSNVTTFAELHGCALPVVRNNVLLPGKERSSTYAQIRIRDCSWPMIYDNHSGGHRLFPGSFTSRQKHMTTTANTSAVDAGPVEFPLLGRKGKAVPTGGSSEVVFAYGAPQSWSPGDTVKMAGTTLTFTTKPDLELGSTEFNSLGKLVERIEGLGFTAGDYGDPWGVVTRHIRVRRNSGGTWQLDIECAAATAGRTLPNREGDGHNIYTVSVGGTDDATVIWSPMANLMCVPTLVATNAAARTLLSNGYMVEDRTKGMDGSYALVVHDDAGGDERFRWAIH